jgi:hypothetical protein
LCVCRFRVAASKQSLDEAPYINCPKLSQTSKYHLQPSLSAFLLDDKPWFLNWGKTCCYIHQNLLLGFTNWPVILLHQLCPSSFLAPSSPRHHLPLKFKLDKVEGRCWWVGPRCQNIWIICVLSEFHFCSPWILDTRLLFWIRPWFLTW